MDYTLSEHALESLRKRPVIRREWLERVLANPKRTEADRVDPDLEHRLGRIDEFGGRVLRVIVNRTKVPLSVVTVYFDRKMRDRL
jgi:hypothetical protein